MRVLVFGGRDFNDVPKLWRVLDVKHLVHCFTLVIDGASDDVTGPRIGADYWANQWARANGIAWKRFHADWKKHGRAAGPIRNGGMLADGQPELGIGFPGGKGTANMAGLLRRAGIEVVEVS